MTVGDVCTSINLSVQPYVFVSLSLVVYVCSSQPTHSIAPPKLSMPIFATSLLSLELALAAISSSSSGIQLSTFPIPFKFREGAKFKNCKVPLSAVRVALRRVVVRPRLPGGRRRNATWVGLGKGRERGGKEGV